MTTGHHLSTVLRSPTHPVVLRPLEPRDAPAVAALLSDHRNTVFDSQSDAPPPQMSVETAAGVVSRMRQSAAAPSVMDVDGGRVSSGPGRVNLAVVLLSSDEVCGTGGGGRGGREGGGGGGGFENEKEAKEEEEEATLIGLSGFGNIDNLPDGRRVGDVGAMIAPAHRRRGFASEAIRLSVGWGFAAVADGGLQLDAITAGTVVANEGMVRLLEARFGPGGTRRPSPVKEGREEIFYEIGPEQWKALQASS